MSSFSYGSGSKVILINKLRLPILRLLLTLVSTCRPFLPLLTLVSTYRPFLPLLTLVSTCRPFLPLLSRFLNSSQRLAKTRQKNAKSKNVAHAQLWCNPMWTKILCYSILFVSLFSFVLLYRYYTTTPWVHSGGGREAGRQGSEKWIFWWFRAGVSLFLSEN